MSPNGARMSWRSIADTLADRLSCQGPCGDHDEPDPDNCPFCADMDALRLYREKGGTVRERRLAGEPTFDVMEHMREVRDAE